MLCCARRYELDMQDVVGSKISDLRRAGAQLEAGGRRGHGHALRAASWQCLAADLTCQVGWFGGRQALQVVDLDGEVSGG
jgi:hypothetical protein